MVNIESSNVILDGLTITSGYGGSDWVNGIYLYKLSSPALTNVKITNCVIRHLAKSNHKYVIEGIGFHGYFSDTEISYNEIRDFQATGSVYDININGPSNSAPNNKVTTNALVNLKSINH